MVGTSPDTTVSHRSGYPESHDTSVSGYPGPWTCGRKRERRTGLNDQSPGVPAGSGTRLPRSTPLPLRRPGPPVLPTPSSSSDPARHGRGGRADVGSTFVRSRSATVPLARRLREGRVDFEEIKIGESMKVYFRYICLNDKPFYCRAKFGVSEVSRHHPSRYPGSFREGGGSRGPSRVPRTPSPRPDSLAHYPCLGPPLTPGPPKPHLSSTERRVLG